MSMTPDQSQSRKIGLGVSLSPSPAPFLTPRPERRRTDSRSVDWNPIRPDKDKEANIQVLLRCRPLSEEEQRSNFSKVISCNEQKREVTVSQTLANKQVDRVFTFDRVFGPKAQQRSIYEQAVVPIVNEVLDGFNCTIFAYGQTGTGKTYTMEGGMRNKGGDLPAEAGVIPRAVRQIFDMLEAQNADYSMKVTFLELYNEEITDLLAPEDSSRLTEDKQKKPINLMEDGKGSVVVRGLEEESVYSVNEIYGLLEKGAARRRTADTLLNKRSSRSHSVFSITIFVKEAAIGDEELIKCGKLNLVDLAGSENISRSGAREVRAREAGEINKSLLTLGRVINALVEHSSHVPYRDSKLTRLLRDSLGGKTKTCIIATITPSVYSLDETLSTLDYASRAKNIKNKPEANQKVSKAILLKDLFLEIERMKEDVRAAREKNGVYIPHDRYSEEEAEKKARNEKIEQLENDLNLSEKQVQNFQELYLAEQEQKLDLEFKLKDCEANLDKRTKELVSLQEDCWVLVSKLNEKESFISKLLQSENLLIDRAKEFCADLRTASDDIVSLSSRLDKKDKIEVENQKVILNFGFQLDESLKDLQKVIVGSASQQQQQLRHINDQVQAHFASKFDATEALESRINKMTEMYTSGVEALKELANGFQSRASSDLEQLNSRVSSQALAVEQFLTSAVSESNAVICSIHNSLNEQKQFLTFFTQHQQEGLKKYLDSAQVVSDATMSFFNDLCNRSSKVMKILEDGKNERLQQLIDFEKLFKEEAAREEEKALEKIAAILAALTSKKTSLVSEASTSIQDSCQQETKRLQQEVSSMVRVSNEAERDVTEYVEQVKCQFVEGSVSAAHSAAMIENCLQECSRKVDVSRQQWQNARISINNLYRNGVTDIESSLKNSISTNHILNQKYLSASLTVDLECNAATHDMLEAVKGALALDQENKKMMDSLTKQCMEQLKSIEVQHDESVLNIRGEAEKCTKKDYLVDNNRGTKVKFMDVPSLESIEEMRTPPFERTKEGPPEHISTKRAQSESKIPSLTMTYRTPFSELKNAN